MIWEIIIQEKDTPKIQTVNFSVGLSNLTEKGKIPDTVFDEDLTSIFFFFCSILTPFSFFYFAPKKFFIVEFN